MTNKLLLAFMGGSICLFALSNLIKGKDKQNKKASQRTKKKMCASLREVQSESAMIEYSRQLSAELGFNRNNEVFKRPSDLKHKWITEEEEIQLERALMQDEQFAQAMKNYISLRTLHTEKVLRNKSIRVFIDTVKDTRVIAIDYSAMLEIDLQQIYNNMAGEFVLINLDKEGERIKVNYVLVEGEITKRKK